MQTPPQVAQPPQLSQVPSKAKLGYYIALGGSAVTLLSFLVLPYVDNLNIAGAAQFSTPSVSLAQASQVAGGIVWLPFVVALVAGIMAALGSFGPVSSSKGKAITIIVMSVIGTLLFLILMGVVSAAVSAGSLGLASVGFGIGAWLCLIGMSATFYGGIMATRNRSLAFAPNAYGQPQYPPQQSSYPNYPPQQQPYPNYPPQQQPYPNYPPQQPSYPNYPPQTPQQPPQY